VDPALQPLSGVRVAAVPQQSLEEMALPIPVAAVAAVAAERGSPVVAVAELVAL